MGGVVAYRPNMHCVARGKQLLRKFLRATTLRQKLQISSSHSIMTPDQPSSRVKLEVLLVACRPSNIHSAAKGGGGGGGHICFENKKFKK